MHLPPIHIDDPEAARLARIRLQVTCTREDGAALLGLPVATWDDWRGKGLVPPPINGTKRWSTAGLMRKFAGDDEAKPIAPMSPFGEWKAAQHG